MTKWVKNLILTHGYIRYIFGGAQWLSCNLFDKAISIINFAKPFLNFIEDTMI